MKNFLLVMVWGGLGNLVGLAGQSVLSPNWRVVKLDRYAAMTTLDVAPVLPGTLQIWEAAGQRLVGAESYRLQGNRLIWQRDSAGLGLTWPLVVRFRVLPAALYQAARLLDSSKVVPAANGVLRWQAGAPAPPGLDFRQLQYSGNFSRGLSLGNRQDLVLNSNFNLQLAGDLGDGLQLVAAISDERIPIQPEGNTIQIQELDRVFLQLKKANQQITVGDYELNRPRDGYFLNYLKKLQGATYEQTMPLGQQGQWQTQLSAAITRGKFARNTIVPLEGNQGPYKLQGNAGERFIIILSGTEKVWLNGEKLQRGQDFDYTIDYNRGEVIFMPRRIIVRESRIIVEFEYADQSYLRSLIAGQSTWQWARLRAYVHYYQEQDSRTTTNGQQIGPTERSILEQAGDDRLKAALSSLRQLEGLNATRASYQRRDTLLPCGRRDSILVWSVDPNQALYSAQFTLVGAGKGDYVLDEQPRANERVYRWVAPDPLSCQPRGDYAPLNQLVLPTQQRLAALGYHWQLGPRGHWRSELSWSQLDLNRFSTRDAGDDQGWALFSELRQENTLGRGPKALRAQWYGSYEGVQQNYRALNPYRLPEFLRDWTLADFQGQGSPVVQSEHLLRGGLQLESPQWGKLGYGFSFFSRGNDFTGLRQEWTGQWSRKGWLLRSGGSWLQAELPQERRQYLRPNLQVEKIFERWKKWSVAWSGELEHNDRRQQSSDTLTGLSFRYWAQRFALKSPEKPRWQTSVEWLDRQDLRPAGEAYQPLTRASEWKWISRWQPNRQWSLNSNLTYRALQTATGSRSDRRQTILGRLDASSILGRGFFRATSTYELGAGQEPRLEYTYVKVAKGQGLYIWQDSLYNRDGIIQPNEMEIAPFADIADYLRVATVGAQYLPVSFTNLNYSLQVEPRARWFNVTKGWKRWVKLLSWQSSVRIGAKNTASTQWRFWNPLNFNLADTNLIALTTTGRHSFFINRGHPRWELQLGRNDNRNKVVQTTGFEARLLAEWLLQWRWNFHPRWSLRQVLRFGDRNSDSEFFNNKDFQLQSRQWEPELNWQPNPNYRLVLQYRWQSERNLLSAEQESTLRNELALETVYAPAGNTALRGRLSLIQLDFKGQANSPIGFALLNGLQPGTNQLWNLSIDRQIARYLQLQFSYEGRKTGGAPTVHVGRMQVSAIF